MKSYTKFLIIILGVFLTIAGCRDYTELNAPAPPDTGTADFKRFVSIGNSLTQGEQSGSVYESGQMYSFGNLIADKVGTQYAEAIFPDPGSGGRIEVASLTPPQFIPNSNSNLPSNSNYQGLYNNLGVKGAFLYDALYTTNAGDCFTSFPPVSTQNLMFDAVLRGQGTVIQQAMMQQPTFVTLWIGNNDVLGYATRGGVFPLTHPTAGSFPNGTYNFKDAFTELMDSISSIPTLTGAAVANIPDVTSVPYFTTVGPQVAQQIPWGLLGGTGLFYQKQGETVASTFADSSSLMNGDVLIILASSPFAQLIGESTGAYYGAGPIPAGIDTTKPFGLHPQNPWPNGFILDGDEIGNVNVTITAYNQIITQLTNAHGFAMVDINTEFNNIAQNGYNEFGLNLNNQFVTGGIFSLDGVHPTNRGYGIVANAFIEAINQKYNAKIPDVNVASLPGSLYFTSLPAAKLGIVNFPAGTYDHILF